MESMRRAPGRGSGSLRQGKGQWHKIDFSSRTSGRISDRSTRKTSESGNLKEPSSHLHPSGHHPPPGADPVRDADTSRNSHAPIDNAIPEEVLDELQVPTCTSTLGCA